MPSDATTFYAAFASVFAGIAFLLWHMESRARRLEERLQALEAEAAKGVPRQGDAPRHGKAGQGLTGREP
jgi:hypothetical protein